MHSLKLAAHVRPLLGNNIGKEVDEVKIGSFIVGSMAGAAIAMLVLRNDRWTTAMNGMGRRMKSGIGDFTNAAKGKMYKNSAGALIEQLASKDHEVAAEMEAIRKMTN